MASFFSDSTSSKANSRSDWRGKVRIVAKIRASNDLEIQSSNGVSAPWISVRKPEGESSDCVTISFGDQSTSRKESYKLDYCYQQDEDVTQIFSREVKPLIPGVFDGLNASIVAYGARGSGKTYLIQGSEEKPGLAPLALAEVLSIAENTESSVAVSCYEVYQDHIYDLLEHSRQEIAILEDALGRIKLKGLSQVPVKSLVELYKLYFHGSTSHKPAHKAKNEVLRRSHKGLIIHVSSKNRDSGSSTVGKINFVDLAGYEDTKRKSIDGYNFVDSTWINMSLYTLQNVVKALNARERVPYRESKLTRMLQDSLGGRNQTLMVTCLNPSFCQDTIYTVSLASQSCQVLNQVSCDSTKKIKNVARIIPLPSPNAARRQTLSNSVKRHNNSQLHVTQKKTNGLLSTPKGRKLFDGANNAMSSLQEKLLVDIAPTIAPSLSNEEKLLVDTVPAIEPSPSNEEKLLVDIAPTIAPSLSNEEKILVDTAPAIEPSPSNEEHSVSSAMLDIQPSQTVKSEISESTIDGEMDLNLIHKEEQSFPVVNTETKSFTVPKEDCNLEKENNLFINSNRSPPLSERLRELSNSLKSLCSTTPLGIEWPQKVDSKFTQDCSYPEEPKTPTVESCTFVKNRETPMETPSFCSPWETYNVMSSGLKQSLAQQYLKFLNSGSKEELKGLKGIGEKRASYILELREESPEPFKDLDDLKAIGLSTKQIKGMMRKFAGDLF